MSSRKQFIKQISLGSMGMLFANQLFADNNSNKEGLVVNENEGEEIMLREGTATVKIKIAKTNGYKTMSFLASSIPPGDSIPVHKHLNEDEVIFIHKGSGVITVGKKEYPLSENLVAMVPKGVWHGIRNTGNESIEMRFAYSPAGFEGYFREVGTPAGQPFIKRSLEERRPIAKKWGMIYKQ
jgi:mannose-6-phosphate isomerase-like protein (cupin superfamily)